MTRKSCFYRVKINMLSICRAINSPNGITH